MSKNRHIRKETKMGDIINFETHKKFTEIEKKAFLDAERKSIAFAMATTLSFCRRLTDVLNDIKPYNLLYTQGINGTEVYYAVASNCFEYTLRMALETYSNFNDREPITVGDLEVAYMAIMNILTDIGLDIDLTGEYKYDCHLSTCEGEDRSNTYMLHKMANSLKKDSFFTGDVPKSYNITLDDTLCKHYPDDSIIRVDFELFDFSEWGLQENE